MLALPLPPPLPLQAPALKNMVTVPKRMLPRLELIKFRVEEMRKRCALQGD